VLQLRELLDAVRLLEADTGEPLPDQVLDLVEPGTSLGGARPKNVVEDDEGLWVAKFPARGDRWSNAPVEAGMLALAGRCGIRVPQTRIERLGSDAVLLVKRFDRERVDGGYVRHRMASALTVVDAEESATDRRRWSYVELAGELQRWSRRPRQDRPELFRRMVFNALISNIDDHPRNHAVIAPGREWELAPAYDLTPSPARSLEWRDLALECGRWGRVARRENLLSEAPRFGLDREAASAVIDELKEIVARCWRDEVKAQGATEAECERIAPAFVYPGFEYPMDRTRAPRL
jgi:serine/threonine-protein kinase HipA